MLAFLEQRSTRILFLALLLVLATVLAHQPAWHGGFIWDDDDYVTRNPLLIAPDGLWRIWFSLDSPSQYFPLTYTIFRFERSLWGLSSSGYHCVNIALHSANALLVWCLLFRLRVPGAFLAGLFFALHPVQVESVVWITELKNVLMGFFFLLTLLAWIRFLDGSGRQQSLSYFTALVLFVLALSAKSTACTLPAALLLIAWLQKRPLTARLFLQVAPFALLGLGMGLLAIWWERFHQGTRGALFSLGPIERILVASRAIWFYLGKLIWPDKLTFIYPQWEISRTNPWAYAWLVALVAAVVVIWFVRRRVGRGPEVAMIFFVATLAPVLGFIMLYTFRYTYVADHYQYLACIGPIALFSAAMVRWSKQGKVAGILSAVCMTAMPLVLGILTWQQSGIYRDVETLWRTTIARNPGCWMAYNNLGIELSRRAELSQATEQYRKSLALRPNFAQAHYNLGTALLERGELDEALAECRTAIDLQSNDPDAHVALGNVLLAKDRAGAAADEYWRALQLRPHDANAHYNLGNVLQQKGDIAAAIAQYEEALRDDPTISEAYLNIGNVLSEEGNVRGAIRSYEQALAIAPGSLKVQNNLAWVLATAEETSLRDGPKAVQLAEKAERTSSGKDPIVLNTLAAAYAEAGRPNEAAAAAERALQIATERGDEETAAELRRVLPLYRNGSRYQKP